MKNLLFMEKGKEEAEQTKRRWRELMRMRKVGEKAEKWFNPIELRPAKTPMSFGWSEFSRVNNIDP